MIAIEEIQDTNPVTSAVILGMLTLKQMEFELIKQIAGIGKAQGDRKLRQGRIDTLTLLINKKKSQRIKSGWIEIEYQELPPGAVFKAYISLDGGKRENKKLFGTVMGSIRKYSRKASQSTLMKSSGEVSILLSPGMDQGSLLTLPSGYFVWVKKPKRILTSDGGAYARDLVDGGADDEI